MLRTIFMGTPNFAVPTLRYLSESQDVVAVFTKPDKPAGRGRRVAASPVKQEALARGLRVLEPRSLRPVEIVGELKRLQPDLIVVAAYGLILPQAVLDVPPRGCINVHASLLPRYRGASPIASALLEGEQETGITLMLMEAGLDTGPILAQRSLPIEAGDNTGLLEANLSLLGADLLEHTLPHWIGGSIVPQPQDVSLATTTHMIKKEDGLIEWSKGATAIVRKIMAFTPWPGAYTTWNGQPLKLLSARRRELNAAPGLVLKDDDLIFVGTGEGSIEILQVQAPGRRPMGAAEFVRGHPEFISSRLGAVQ